jgi:hypothetical protein
MDPSSLPPQLQELLAGFTHPSIQLCVAAIEAVAGRHSSQEEKAPFLRFHAFITSNPPPAYISAWKSNPKHSHWYERHINGMLGHVQNALSCAWCHCINLCGIEDHVQRMLLETGVQAQLEKRNMSIGIGNSIRLDAEYQAFVLAVRRCLDYLARCLARISNFSITPSESSPIFWPR